MWLNACGGELQVTLIFLYFKKLMHIVWKVIIEKIIYLVEKN